MGRSSTEEELERRVKQQEVVAELGQQALETDDLDQLMYDAAVAVTGVLDTEYCKVLEVLPGGDELLLRHGVGWRDGLVGTATVPSDLDSQAGFTLISEAPVIVDDLGTEERFSGPTLLTDHDVVSGISVVIGSTDDPWGVLGTHTTDQRTFSDRDAAFVQSVANVLASAIERTERARELQQKEQRYEAIFEDPHLLVGLLDPDGTLQEANETAMAYLDADPETVLGEPLWETRWWDDEASQPDGHEWLMRAAAGEYVEFESTFTGHDGTEIALSGFFRPVTDPDGNVVSIIVSARDITAQRRRERALEESERRYRTLVEHFPNGAVTLVDEELHYRTVGGTPLDVANVTVEEAENRPVADVVTPELADELVPRYEAALKGEKSTFDLELDGRFYQFQIVPIRDNDGDIFGALGMSQDVTERVVAQRQTEASEQRYRTLVDNFPNGSVGLFDEELTYTAVGGQLMDTLNTDPEDRVGRKIPDLYPGEIIEKVEPYFHAALDGEANEFEVEYKGRDLYANTLPIRDADGEIYAGMLVVQDVTERREYERQLEVSNERLEQFAYAASHDLQEPLRMVTSYLQLIERRYGDELDEEAEEFIDFAVDGAERMREMIDGLLEYSRVETRGDPFETVDLDDVLDAVRKDLQLRIEETDAEITAESLPRVLGDRSQLNQVLQNLLSNAIEYSGDEPPRINVSAERASGGDEWVVSVSDEGIGIDPDDQQQIFEVFRSLHSQEESGTGIGLALCERIIERHDGDIWVDSERGEGATFSFTLPAVDAAD